MQAHWAIKYLNKPWAPYGRGPDKFDCYGLHWYVQQHEFGKALPRMLAVDPHCIMDIGKCIQKEIQQGNRWVKLAQPKEGCAVVLSQNQVPHHIGTWTAADGGLVLHALDYHKVLLQSKNELHRLGWKLIQFYEWVL